VTLAAVTAGTGTDNINLILTPAGTGTVQVSGNMIADGYYMSAVTASGLDVPATTYSLSLHGQSNVTGDILMRPSWATTGGAFRVQANTTDVFTVLMTGNVGIGTTTPNYVLDIQGASGHINTVSTTGTNSVYHRFANTSGNALVGIDSSAGGALLAGGSPYALVISHNGGYPLQFGTSGTVRATIDSSGNVGVGTTTPGRKLEVNGEVKFGGTDWGNLYGYTNAGAWVYGIAASSGNTFFNNGGNFGIGTATFGTNAVKVLAIGSGTAPTTSPADECQLWVEDVGGAGQAELRVRDELGNVTTLSPHRFELFQPKSDYIFPWSYYSENAFIGKAINVDMYGAIAEVERLSGKKFIYTADIKKSSWDDNQEQNGRDRDAQVDAANARIASLEAKIAELEERIAAVPEGVDMAPLEKEREDAAKERAGVNVPKKYRKRKPPKWIETRHSN
jgi:hypothetical protein